jgi:hypothetical protein
MWDHAFSDGPSEETGLHLAAKLRENATTPNRPRYRRGTSKSARKLFVKAGYKVEAAHTGAGALERISTGECDMIVVDPPLPDMDGLDIIPGVRHPVVDADYYSLRTR